MSFSNLFNAFKAFMKSEEIQFNLQKFGQSFKFGFIWTCEFYFVVTLE